MDDCLKMSVQSERLCMLSTLSFARRRLLSGSQNHKPKNAAALAAGSNGRNNKKKDMLFKKA